MADQQQPVVTSFADEGEQQQQQQQQTADEGDQSKQQQQTAASAQTSAGAQQEDFQGDHAFLIVGDRAFASKEAVTTKIQAQDQFIAKVTGENKEMRETIASLTQDIERLKLSLEGMKPGTTSGNAVEDNHQLSKEELVQAVVSTVESRQARNENESKRTENIKACFADASTLYGDNMKATIKSMADNLNMSLVDVDEMAKSRPQVFRQLFLPKEDGKIPSQPVQSGVNLAALRQQPEQNSWSAKGKKSNEISDEVSRRLAAFKDE